MSIQETNTFAPIETAELSLEWYAGSTGYDPSSSDQRYPCQRSRNAAQKMLSP